MPTCEICGKKTNKLYRVKIEGVEMLVCKECAKYGELIGEASEDVKKPKKVKKEIKVEVEEAIVPNYPKIIREARERLGLTQEQMAKKLKLKESLYKKIEEGKLEPTIDIAKRIEKELNVKLVEEISGEKFENESGEKNLTLGDVVTIRKRKK